MSAPPRVVSAPRSALPRRRRFGYRQAPLLLFVAIVAANLVLGRSAGVFSLLMGVPLAAAGVETVAATALYGLASIAGVALLGLYNHAYSTGPEGQVVRLVGVVIGSSLAVALARNRTRRERQMRDVQRVAEVAQRAILASLPERLGVLRLGASYDSASAEATIGGDIYAVVDTPYGVRLLIADTRGKGLEAVQLGALVLGAFRERAHERPGLSALFADLDSAVRRAAGDEDFVTAVLAQVDSTGLLTFVNAGHPPALLLRDGVPALLEPADPQPPLGLSDGGRPSELDLRSGDRLLLYTDGLTEARDRKGRFLPLDRICTAVAEGGIPDALDAVRRELLRWVGHHRDDDVALLMLEVGPLPG